MELYSGKMDLAVEGWLSSPLVSLREAARLLNPQNAFQGGICNCKSGCKGKMCICQQKNALCSTKCHSGIVCKNSSMQDCVSIKRRKDDLKSQTEPPTKKKKIEPSEIVELSSSEEEIEELPFALQSWLPNLNLSQKDKLELNNDEWLSDTHISAAQQLLNKQFKHIGSLQHSFLEQMNQFKPITSNGVQIINENQNHWICLSTTLSPPNTIDVYNSLPRRISAHVAKQCGLLLKSNQKKIILRSMHCPQQTGSNDCGLFAIAHATELCFGGNPSSVIYDQASMRKHLLNCFLQDKLTPFPKEDVRVEISSEVDGISEIKVYCSCRLPEDKKQRMAKCMKCSEWFHEKCLKIPKSVFSRKSSYNCPDCTGP